MYNATFNNAKPYSCKLQNGMEEETHFKRVLQAGLALANSTKLLIKYMPGFLELQMT